jgi:queuine tRNA-ribosyltransferase
MAGEMLGPILATMHNLAYYQTLMSRIRRAIGDGTFSELKAEVRAIFTRED